MKPVIGKHKLTIIFIFLAVILDRISKILVATLLPEYMPVRVIGNFFRLIFIKNKGIAFGLFSTWEHSLKTPLLLILSLVALYFVIKLYLSSEQKKLIQISYGLILGGAFSNLYDRIIYGEVIDFLDFGIGNHRFPTFNIADSCITIGIILILAYSIFTRNTPDQQTDKQQ